MRTSNAALVLGEEEERDRRAVSLYQICQAALKQRWTNSAQASYTVNLHAGMDLWQTFECLKL